MIIWYQNYVEKCMEKKKEEKKGGGNVGHDLMYLCFYDHNFPYLSGTSIKKNSSASRTRVSFLMQLLCGDVK